MEVKILIRASADKQSLSREPLFSAPDKWIDRNQTQSCSRVRRRSHSSLSSSSRLRQEKKRFICKTKSCKSVFFLLFAGFFRVIFLVSEAAGELINKANSFSHLQLLLSGSAVSAAPSAQPLICNGPIPQKAGTELMTSARGAKVRGPSARNPARGPL